MVCGFVPGKGAIDAIFNARELQEEFISAKKRELYLGYSLSKKSSLVGPQKLGS